MESKRPYYPLLDTTRFIAFIPVFLTHCFVTDNVQIVGNSLFVQLTHFLEVGLLGLDYFFVLSSFLITRLIIDEQQRFKSFNFKLFFIRRSLRIWPLYFLMVAIGFTLQFSGFLSEQLPPFLSFASFTLNLYIAQYGYNFLFFLVFLWSISVEEQFYIFWGLFIRFTSVLKPNLLKHLIPFVAMGLIVVSLIFRVFNLDNELRLYFHTFSVTANFGVGILLAWLITYKESVVQFFSSVSKAGLLLTASIAILSTIGYTFIFTTPITIVFERLYFSILFAFVIGFLCFSTRIYIKAEWLKPFDYLGKISLGLYFYHGIVITAFILLSRKFPISNSYSMVLLINPIIMMIATIILASLSYNYFEKPILALKTKFYQK